MLVFRKVNENDINLVHEWANEKKARENSYNPDHIPFETHQRWFQMQLEDKNSVFLIFETPNNEAVGFVRFNKKDEKWVVSINIGKKYRGKGLAVEMLQRSAIYLFNNFNIDFVIAHIMFKNIASKKAFEKAGYVFDKKIIINNIPSYQYKLEKKNITG